MNQLFAAFVALLLSFCHHSAASRPSEASLVYATPAPSSVLTFPDRQDLARAASDSGYAGSECLSCRTMNASYTVR